MEKYALGDSAVSVHDVQRVACENVQVVLSDQARARMVASRVCVEQALSDGKPYYGINTGFGALAEVRISNEALLDVQKNLVLSHAAGVGNPLSQEETRAMMFLRAQTMALGFSGARPCVAEHLLNMLNAGIHPLIPEKGSVGASGDLAPLAHIAMGMIGEGDVLFNNQRMPASEALHLHGLEPLVLQAKEGLVLLNGTQGMCALGCLNVWQAHRLVQWVDVVGSMTWAALQGCLPAFDSRIHQARPHPGQIQSALRITHVLKPLDAALLSGGHKVQDPYSLRCMPQVHGASSDAVAYVYGVLEREINSATDNPLVFVENGDVLSGGNFHGQPLALALDFACMAVSEWANISERRIEQMLNPALSGLPAFLAAQSGVHSGFMIAQLTAASLVNENKMFCTPSSVDSIPGSAAREDHVSMGMTSARALREVVRNVYTVLAIELLCAVQALDLRGVAHHLHGPLLHVYQAVRSEVPFVQTDTYMAKRIEGVLKVITTLDLQL